MRPAVTGGASGTDYDGDEMIVSHVLLGLTLILAIAGIADYVRWARR